MCSKSCIPIVSGVIEDINGLQCVACTYLNYSDAENCEICGTVMFVDSDSDSSDSVEEDMEDESEVKVGVEERGKVWYISAAHSNLAN